MLHSNIRRRPTFLLKQFGVAALYAFLIHSMTGRVGQLDGRITFCCPPVAEMVILPLSAEEGSI